MPQQMRYAPMMPAPPWKVLVLSCATALLAAPLRPAAHASAPSVSRGSRIDFVRDIKPILANHCFACHGPDPGPRKAGLRLDLRQEAFKEARSGARTIVPGKSAESE